MGNDELRCRETDPMNRTVRILLLGCIFSVGCSSHPQQPAQMQQMQFPVEYQRRLHDSPEKSPLRPIEGQYVDLNKNGHMDAYENPDLSIERRIDDLLSKMTLEEKTCQLCTLYGYLRQLKDDLPKPIWKDAIWKDGIANIDEHLNGWKGGRGIGVEGGIVR